MLLSRSAVFLATAGAAVAASTYTVAVIPAPSGLTIYSIIGINDSGQVAGTGSIGATNEAFIGSPSGSTAIPLLAGWRSSFGAGINNSGQVVGSVLGLGQAVIGTVAGGTVIPFPAGWTSAAGIAVSASGQVAGSGSTFGSGPTSQAFIGTVSRSIAIPLPAGWSSAVGQGVNAFGQVTGYGASGSASLAFIGTTSGSTAVPVLSGWSFMQGEAINDSSQIAGIAFDYSGAEQAFIGTASGSTAIPLPIGATSAWVANASQSINNLGTVVGGSDAGGWIWDASDGTVLLSALVPVGWNVTNAISISNNGLILAQASYMGGTPQFVELTPAGCGFSLSSTSFSQGVQAASDSVVVTAAAGCGWTASSNAVWLSITSGASGNGNGTVNFIIDANPGPPRVGTLTLAGQTFTVNQAGLPSRPILVSPANKATGIVLAPTLGWSVSSGATSYNVYFGSSPTPPLAISTTSTSYNTGALAANSTYYWQVVATNSAGSALSAVWSFTTSAATILAPAGAAPGAGSGLTQTFNFTFTDTAGFADLSVLDVLINNYLDGRTACYFALVPASATSGYLYLVDDAGDGGYVSGTPMLLPSIGSLTNSQCTLNGTGGSISASGNTLTLTLSIMFKAAFAGNKVFYVAARSNTQNSGWQALGTWNVPGLSSGGPAVSGMTPGRSTTTGTIYTFTFTDTNGYTDLNVLDILTNSFLDGIGACYVAYVPTGPTTGYLYLVDDAGDGHYASGSPMLLSAGGTLQNSQCVINTAGSSASASENTLNLNLAISFKAGFAGNQVFYLAARNASTGNSGWQPAGSVTVP